MAGTKKSIATLSEQIKSLQAQLKDADGKTSTAATLLAQLQQFKLDVAKAIEDKAAVQVEAQIRSAQLETLQGQLASLL